jgi:6-phosphogluconate dehydrogenase
MMEKEKADIGLIGLAVMGQNLALNIVDHGFNIVVFNRTTEKVTQFLEGPAKGTKMQGATTLKEFFSKLKRPRKALFMVKAGQPVDDLIQESLPFLEKGDVLIDGGNSHYPDTQRRCDELEKLGILYIGAGVSGGEEGARHGPSIMPGGHQAAWPLVKPIFQAIAAKSGDGTPCCDWVGDGGSGHYVKMVHNGIEYGDMQIICESYQLLKEALKLTYPELASVYQHWNETELKSYLIEITAKIFTVKDKDGSFLVEKILDVAGQKGTGKWTGISALELGVPLTLIAEAVFARCLSSYHDDRVQLAKHYPKKSSHSVSDKKLFTDHLRKAVYSAKILSYAQGFMLMKAAADEMKWKLNYGAIALMWRGGCIIRSEFLGDIKKAYDKNPLLKSFLFDPFFEKELKNAIDGLRATLCLAIEHSVAVPTLSSALSFFDGMTTARLPANLLQAQRDFFGAHTYERLDEPRGQFFHTNWTGTGGNVSSSTYNV